MRAIRGRALSGRSREQRLVPSTNREGAFGRGSFDMLMRESNAEPFSRIGADILSPEAKDRFTNRVSSWFDAFA